MTTCGGDLGRAAGKREAEVVRREDCGQGNGSEDGEELEPHTLSTSPAARKILIQPEERTAAQMCVHTAASSEWSKR